MLSSLLAIALLILLFGLTYGVGRLVVLRLVAGVASLERVVFAVPGGIGIIGLLVWICGLLGLLSPILFWSVLALGVPGFALLIRDGWNSRRPDEGALKSRLVFAIAGTIAILLFCTFTAALAPPSGLEWDALSYHLANQKTWLAHGRIDYLPWDHHSNFPFIVQMLYLLMMGAGSVSGAKLVHWLCGVLLVTSVYTFCQRYFLDVSASTGPVVPSDGRAKSPIVGAVAALLLATTPIVLWESTVGYVDLATALFTWLSLYALINAAEPNLTPSTRLSQFAGYPPGGKGEERGEKILPSPSEERAYRRGVGGEVWSLYWLIVSAVMMGFALGTKYTVLGFWGLLLLGILGWNLVLHRKWAKETLPHAASWGGISLILGLPWYIKNWIVVGNPVYPFAYSILGGKYWSVENAKQYAEEQGKFGFGKTALDLLLSPWRVTNELAFFPAYHAETGRRFIFTEYMFFGLSPVFIALLLALPLIGRRLSRVSFYCLLFGFGVYAFWFFMMQQTRYLIPALPAFAIVIAEALVLLWAERKSLARYVAVGLVAITTLWALFLVSGLAFFGIPFAGLAPALPVVIGQVSQEDYVKATLPGLGAACFWINENTGKDEKVAIFDETRGFYLDREYVWAQPDNAEGLLPWNDYKDVDDWLADFKKRGYTVLLLGTPPEKFPASDTRRWRSLMIEAIQSDKVTLAFDEKGVQVYRIP
jgi:4-amino-4-deoxy-L-arabinose transferase-like glycosyltransferase